MKAYLEITLLPNNDIGHYFLWSKVFQQIHLALVELKKDNDTSLCGITFPEFNEQKNQLGQKIRVFAPEKKQLEALNLVKWLKRLHDYTHMTHIRDVPDHVDQYVRFTRVQIKSSRQRLARRAVKRHSIRYAQAIANLADFQPKYSAVPFIQLKSLGNGNQFRLLISKETMSEVSNPSAQFNSYGLSNGSVLPCF